MSNEIALMREIARLEEKINALRTIEIGGVWQDWTSVISPSVGAITSYTIAYARYTVIGKFLSLKADFTITNNGTGSGVLFCSLPINAIGNSILVGRGQDGNILQGIAIGGLCWIFTYNNLYPGGTGHRIRLSGNYEIA